MSRLTFCLGVVIGLLCCCSTGSFAATATVVGTDTTTQGIWQGVYGTIGYYIPNSVSKTPTDGSMFNPGAALLWTWGTNVASTTALKTGASTNIASCWYNNLGTTFPSVTLDVVVPSGQTQTVAVYFLDYDKQGRVESVTVTDAANTPLAGPTVLSGTNFTNGEYLVWNITGEVHINITLLNGPNAVADGIFFGISSTSPAAAGAYFTQKLNQSVTAGTNPTVATLTLPAGTYLIHADISTQLGVPSPDTTFLSELCQIADFEQNTFATTNTVTPTVPTSSTIVSSSMSASLSIRTPTDQVILACGGNANLSFSATLYALPLQSINTQ